MDLERELAELKSIMDLDKYLVKQFAKILKSSKILSKHAQNVYDFAAKNKPIREVEYRIALTKVEIELLKQLILAFRNIMNNIRVQTTIKSDWEGRAKIYHEQLKNTMEKELAIMRDEIIEIMQLEAQT